MSVGLKHYIRKNNSPTIDLSEEEEEEGGGGGGGGGGDLDDH
jgi:hypothetical protein